MAEKKQVFTQSQLYTGRRVTIKRGLNKEQTGRIANGGQCSETQFAFSGDNGEEYCVARSAITKLGT